jgi:tetratricopeptide (TPR) repeat protein
MGKLKQFLSSAGVIYFCLGLGIVFTVAIILLETGAGANSEPSGYYPTAAAPAGSLILVDDITSPGNSIPANPSTSREYYARAYSYIGKPDYDKAIADLTEAIQLEPGYARAYWLRAFAYLQKKEYDKSIADNTEAIRYDPKFAYPYQDRSDALSRKGEYDAAKEDIGKYIALMPNKPNGYNNRGVLFSKIG